MTNTLISINAAAALLGVCTRTVLRWEKLGRLKPDMMTKGGHRRYSVTTIDQLRKTLEEERRTKPPPSHLFKDERFAPGELKWISSSVEDDPDTDEE